MTKRLFAYIGLSMLVTFAVAFYLGFYGEAFALSFAAVLILLSLFIKKLKPDRRVYILVSAVIIFSTFYINIFNSVSELKTEKYNGRQCAVSGVLMNNRKSYDIYYYEISCDKIDGESADYKIFFRTGIDIGAELGDRVNCKVKLKRADNNYYKSRGFDFSAYSENYVFDYTVESLRNKDIKAFPAILREKLTYAQTVLISGYEAELCNAVSLGDKYKLSPELYSAFKSTGLSYIIVVSGMHMSIIASYIFLVTRFFGRKRAGKTGGRVTAILCILLYVSITGFAPSAVRSGIMIIVLILGKSFNRSGDGFNSLGFAALLLTAANPFTVGDIGMLMSFASVAGLIYFLPKLLEKFDAKFYIRIKNLYFLRRCAVNINDKIRVNLKLNLIYALRSVYSIFAASFCAVIAISPLTLLFFGICNPFVIFYSILISPFIGGLMILSIISAVLWYIPILKILSLGTAFIAKIIAKWIVFAVNGIADIPFITFYSSPFKMRLWFGLTIVLLAAATLFKNRRKSVITAVLLSFVILAVNYSASFIMDSDKTELTVYSAGEGVCVSLSSPYGVDILSEGGSDYNFESVSERLHTKSDRIKTLIVPSAREKREMNYADDLLNEFDVEKVLLYYRFNTNERVYRKAAECKVYREFSEEDTLSVKLTENVYDEIINIKNRTWQYVFDGFTSVLIAPYKADASLLPEKYKSPDYLLMCGEPENLDELNYGEIVWTSSAKPSDLYRNVSSVNNDDFKIEFG